MTQDDPIEVYLDQLLVELRGSPRMVRRVLAESEAHLRDAVGDGVDPGEAVRRFGDARSVAVACNRQTGVPVSVLLRQPLLAACLPASVGWRTTSGLGQWLSAALVSAAVGAAFGMWLLRTLRHPQYAEEHAPAWPEAAGWRRRRPSITWSWPS